MQRGIIGETARMQLTPDRREGPAGDVILRRPCECDSAKSRAPAAEAPSALGAPDIVVVMQKVEDGVLRIQLAEAVARGPLLPTPPYRLLWHKPLLEGLDHAAAVRLCARPPHVLGHDGGRRQPNQPRTLRRTAKPSQQTPRQEPPGMSPCCAR